MGRGGASRARARAARAKGQTMVFEQVMLFTIGVAIFAICFFVFSSYESYFLKMGNTDQLEQVRDYIAYAIVKSSEGWDGTESRLHVDIPKTIGGEQYRIRLSDGGLELRLSVSDERSASGLYWLNETLSLGGETTSASGAVTLYKNGNRIIVS